jgi:hypothetical protein
MRRTKSIRAPALLLLATLLTLSCADTGADPSGFPGGAGGGSEASGFYGGAGAGGTQQGTSTNAGQGGTSAGFNTGGGSSVCMDFCEFLVECAAQAPAYGYDWAVPNRHASPEAATGLAGSGQYCIPFCSCMVGKVPALATYLDIALDHATCSHGLDVDLPSRDRARVEALADAFDEDAVVLAVETCADELGLAEYGDSDFE